MKKGFQNHKNQFDHKKKIYLCSNPYFNSQIIIMEREHQNIFKQTLDQDQTTQVKSQNILRKFTIDGKMSFFPRQESNNLKILIYFVLLSLSTLHTVITQQLISNEAYSLTFIDFIQFIYNSIEFYRILFVILIILKVFLILSICMEVIFKRTVFGVSWINKNIIESYTTFKEIDLVFSAFMTLFNWQQNIGFLVTSSIINIFHVIYLQNYIIRRDHLYVTSSTHNLIFKGVFLFNYFANVFFLISGVELYLLMYYTLMFVTLLGWFLNCGNQLYLHQFSKRAFLSIVAFFLSIYVSFIEKFILNDPVINVNSIAQFLLTFVIILSSLYLMLYTTSDKLSKLINKGSSQVKNIDLMLVKLLQSSLSNKDSDSKLIGLLQMFYEHTPSNHNGCFIRQQQFYDPFLKEEIKHSDVYLQKESALRFFIKQLYQKSLQEDPSTENYLNYCEFLYNQYDNIYFVLEQINRIKNQSLNIIQKVKITKISILLEELNTKLNHQLYEGNLQIEHILQSEQCFDIIENKIKQFIFGNLDIWSSLQLQEIQLVEFRSMFKKQLNLVEQISHHWKSISKFFRVNRVWRFIYFNFMLFIKNEKIKQKEADFFTSISIQESIFSHLNIYFEQGIAEEKLYDSQIMFNKDTCCITVAYQLDELIIKEVNNRFTKMTGYTKDQIKGSKLSVLMPQDIIQTHKTKFDQWIKTGYISNEASYHVKFTTFITKKKNQIPTLKYYKAHYQIDEGLEFVCILKSNIKPIVTDDEEKYRMKSMKFIKREYALPTEFVNNKEFEQNEKTDVSIEKNVFIKEDTLQPNKNFTDITYFKVIARLFTFVMLVSMIILAAITNIDSSHLTSYSNQFITFMNIYRFPIVLGTNYMKKILGIGNITKINAQIQATTTNMLQNSFMKITQMTLFDESLNPPNTYLPYYNYSFLQNSSLSQIDLFYTILSSISTLNQPVINRTSQQFQRFHSYLKPGYDTMMNTTKYRFHETFCQIFTSAINKQIWFILGQSIIVFIFITILFKFIHSFINKMKNTLLILLDFHPTQILQAYKYWKEVNDNFHILFLSVHQQRKSCRGLYRNHSNLRNKEDRMKEDHTSMNNQVKTAKEDAEIRTLYIKLRVLLVVIMIAILAVSISIQLVMMSNLRSLQTFEQDGFFFLRYFPTGHEVAMGCIQKYYADQYPAELAFKPQKYEDVLSSMYIFGNNNSYIGAVTDPSSLYYIKQKNYFFGNPCEYNPSILAAVGISVQKCETMCNGTFKQGISSYLRYGQKLGESCIKNKTHLSKAQMNEFTQAGTLISGYVLDAITTWASQFSEKVIDLETQNFINCGIIFGLILAIHFVVLEIKLIRFINNEYEFIKHVYLHFVPQFILISEKVIRQKFIIEGIINN